MRKDLVKILGKRGKTGITNFPVRLPVVLAASLGLALLSACNHPGPRFNPRAQPGATGAALETVARTNLIKSEWLKPPTDLFTLGPGDKLEIELLDDPTSKSIA